MEHIEKEVEKVEEVDVSLFLSLHLFPRGWEGEREG